MAAENMSLLIFAGASCSAVVCLVCALLSGVAHAFFSWCLSFGGDSSV